MSDGTAKRYATVQLAVAGVGLGAGAVGLVHVLLTAP
jgi:hypothetical protein